MAGLKKTSGLVLVFISSASPDNEWSKDQLLFSFCFVMSVGFPRLLVSFVALLTSSSSSPERGVSWCSCSGGGGHFLPLCVLLAVSLASLWGQRPNQVSKCRLKQHFRSQAGRVVIFGWLQMWPRWRGMAPGTEPRLAPWGESHSPHDWYAA